jgi:hypothetical protein
MCSYHISFGYLEGIYDKKHNKDIIKRDNLEFDISSDGK